MTLHAGLTYFSLIPLTVTAVETEYDNNNNNCINDILLANMHIDSGYLVVVTKEGSD